MSVTCPKCKSLCSDDERYCPMCGTRLPAGPEQGAESSPSEAGADQPHSVASESSDDDMEFIPLVVPPPQTSRFPSLTGRERDKWKWIVAALLVVVALAGAVWGGMALFGDDSGEDPPTQLEAGPSPTEADLTGPATAGVATPDAAASPSAGLPADTGASRSQVEPTAEPSATDLSLAISSTEPAVELANADTSSSLAVGSRLGGTPTATQTRGEQQLGGSNTDALAPSARGERNNNVESLHAESGATTGAPTATSTTSPSPTATRTPRATASPTPTSTPTATSPIEPTATVIPIVSRQPVFAGTPQPPLAPETPGGRNDGGTSLVGSMLEALDELVIQALGDLATPINGDGTGGVVLVPDELEAAVESTPTSAPELTGD